MTSWSLKRGLTPKPLMQLKRNRAFSTSAGGAGANLYRQHQYAAAAAAAAAAASASSSGSSNRRGSVSSSVMAGGGSGGGHGLTPSQAKALQLASSQPRGVGVTDSWPGGGFAPGALDGGFLWIYTSAFVMGYGRFSSLHSQSITYTIVDVCFYSASFLCMQACLAATPSACSLVPHQPPAWNSIRWTLLATWWAATTAASRGAVPAMGSKRLRVN